MAAGSAAGVLTSRSSHCRDLGILLPLSLPQSYSSFQTYGWILLFNSLKKLSFALSQILRSISTTVFRYDRVPLQSYEFILYIHKDYSKKGSGSTSQLLQDTKRARKPEASPHPSPPPRQPRVSRVSRRLPLPGRISSPETVCIVASKEEWSGVLGPLLTLHN